MKKVAHIKNNIVIGILACDDSFEKDIIAADDKYELYNPEIHPWGPYGICDVEVGAGWKNRLKEKLGYCIFCGDGLPVTDQSGSL
jgi:hypothetical protein